MEAIHGQPEVLGGLRIGDLAPAILLEGRDRASRLAEAPARGTSHRIDLADEIDHGSANSRERVDAEVRALVRVEALDGAQKALDAGPNEVIGVHRRRQGSSQPARHVAHQMDVALDDDVSGLGRGPGPIGGPGRIHLLAAHGLASGFEGPAIGLAHGFHWRLLGSRCLMHQP